LAVVLLLPATGTAQSLRITPPRPLVAAGDTLRLRVEVLDAAGRVIPNARVIFQPSGGDQQAFIDSTGLVLGAARGTAAFAVTGLISGQRPIVQRMEVRVGPEPAVRVEITPSPSRLVVGQRVSLQAKAFSAAGDPAADRLAWRSSAAGIVRSVGDGVLEAVAPGRATIETRAGRAVASLPVTVVAARPARLSIEPTTRVARQGDVIAFRALVLDAAGRAIDSIPAQWAMSGGPGIMDADGTFVGYDDGRYTIRATVGALTAETVVTLAERDVRRRAQLVGSVARSAFSTSEVWVHPNGQVAYLGTLGDRLYAIDISNPASPVIVDSIVANTRHVNDIMSTADGKWLVFTRENADNRRNGIVIASLEEPLHPTPVSEFTDGVTAGVHSAFVYTQPRHGTHVYLTNDGTGAMHVVDINDPRHPKPVAVWKTPRADAGRSLHDIDVQDGLLYGSWWNDGLVILDVGNGIRGGSPSNPQLVSQYKYDLDKLYGALSKFDPAGYIRGTHTAWRHGKYVFIADEVFSNEDVQAVLNKRPSRAYGNLQVIDVSDVTKPRSVAHYVPEYGGVHNIWVAGDTLYVGAYNAGFRAFDVSGDLRGDLRAQGREIADYMTGSPEGVIPNAAMTWGAVVKNNLIFVNDFNAGLFILRLQPKQQVVP
jgi:hypothetical protein